MWTRLRLQPHPSSLKPAAAAFTDSKSRLLSISGDHLEVRASAEQRQHGVLNPIARRIQETGHSDERQVLHAAAVRQRKH